MNNRLIDGANKHVQEVMKGTMGALKEIQSAPVGKEPRSKKELAIMMKDLINTPSDQRQVKMQDLATLSGHKGAGLDDCDLCKTLIEHAKGQ